MFDLWSTYLGDQWSIGAWDAMRAAAPDRLPAWMQAFPIGDEPRQELKEYDPEWGRAFWTGTVGRVVRPRADAPQREGAARPAHPPLPHGRRDHRASLMGALADVQAQRVQELLREAGVTVDYRSFPDGRPLDARHRARPLRRHPARLGRHRSTAVKIDVHAHYLPDFYREALRAGRPRPARRVPVHPGVVGRRARAR